MRPFVDPLLLIVLITMALLGYFVGLLASCVAGMVGVSLLLNKMMTQFRAIRMSLNRWDNVVDRFENALSSPIDQARKEQS